MGMKKEKAMLILDPAPDCCWSCPMLRCETKDKFMCMITEDHCYNCMITEDHCYNCMITEDHCYNVAEERQINCPLKIFK